MLCSHFEYVNGSVALYFYLLKFLGFLGLAVALFGVWLGLGRAFDWLVPVTCLLLLDSGRNFLFDCDRLVGDQRAEKTVDVLGALGTRPAFGIINFENDIGNIRLFGLAVERQARERLLLG